MTSIPAIAGLLAAAATLLSCANPSRLAEPVQRVRIVDEKGEPVANARVELFVHAWSKRPCASARTDRTGVATFERLTPDVYVVHAAAPPRWNILENVAEDRIIRLSGDTVTVPVQELQLVGVRLPGGRLINSWESSWGGYYPAREQVVAEVRRWSADAVVIRGFKPPSAPCDAQMVFRAEWFGYEPYVARLPWTPASQFAGPRILERSRLKSIPWRELPVLLRDPDGTPMPSACMRAVRRQCELIRRDDTKFHRRYGLEPSTGSPDRLAVPCGPYVLRLHKTGPSRDVPLTIGEGTDTIDCKLPLRLRLLRVRLHGVVGTNWTIEVSGEGHFSATWLHTPDAVVEIPLLLGESTLEFRRQLDGGRLHRQTRRVTIRDEDVQEIEWDVE